MTQPKQASRAPRGMRVYKWPPQPPHELEVVSVTSITGVYPKPWLGGWSAKMVAEFAVDRLDDWQSLAEKDPRAAIDLLKRAPYRTRDAKAEMGTIAHAAVEAYLAGKPLTKSGLEEILTERRVDRSKWKATAGFIAGAMEFLFDQEPEVFHSEATMYSRAHGYAGTADIVGRLRIGKTKRLAIIDFKTGKSVYDEAGLQLGAYAHCDFVGKDDGSEHPLYPARLKGPIRDGVIVRLTPTGRYEPAHFHLTDELQEVFLALKTIAMGEDVVKQSRGRGL